MKKNRLFSIVLSISVSNGIHAMHCVRESWVTKCFKSLEHTMYLASSNSVSPAQRCFDTLKAHELRRNKTALPQLKDVSDNIICEHELLKTSLNIFGHYKREAVKKNASNKEECISKEETNTIKDHEKEIITMAHMIEKARLKRTGKEKLLAAIHEIRMYRKDALPGHFDFHARMQYKDLPETFIEKYDTFLRLDAQYLALEVRLVNIILDYAHCNG